MITAHKKFAGILKKYLLKLKLRGWIRGYGFYSKACFDVDGVNTRKLIELRKLLEDCGYKVREYHNGFSANLINYQQPLYYPQAKLHLKRMTKKV
jgi:hypothetical protein